MRAEYLPEIYSSFYYSCRNFIADLAIFLYGISIPGKIKNLPQNIFNTLFRKFQRPTAGQQLLPITDTYRLEPAPKLRTLYQ
jgi:hypothetical protein